MTADTPLQSQLEDFEKDRDHYLSGEKKFRQLIEGLLTDKEISLPVAIESRTKDIESLRKKVSYKDYTDISQITDLIGLRIICYYRDDVDRIATIIEQEFAIDGQNSINKTKLSEEQNQFGYQSVHYICTLSSDRQQLTEWKKYASIKFELQIRSLLQHVWALFQHKLNYKSEIAIPQAVHREFLQMCALLEVSDKTYMQLRDKIYTIQQEAAKKITNRQLDQALNLETLAKYLESEPIAQLKQHAIDSGYTLNEDTDYHSASSTLNLLKFLSVAEITTLKELDALLASVTETASQFLSDLNKKTPFHLNAAPQYLIELLILYHLLSKPSQQSQQTWQKLATLNHFNRAVLWNICELTGQTSALKKQ